MSLELVRSGASFKFVESLAGFDERTIVAVVQIAFGGFLAPIVKCFGLRLFVYLFSGILRP